MWEEVGWMKIREGWVIVGRGREDEIWGCRMREGWVDVGRAKGR